MATKKTRAGVDHLLWPTKTFSVGPVNVTVERQIAMHSMVITRVLSALPEPADNAEALHQITFARIMAQTTEVSGLDLPFPDTGAGPDEWRAAYAQFLRMDRTLMDEWYEALKAVDSPPNDGEFWPSHKLTEDERKNHPRAGLNGKAASGAGSKPTPPSETTTSDPDASASRTTGA